MERIEDTGRDNLGLGENGVGHKADTSELSAIGGEYLIGDMTLNITPSRLMLLQKINSPFLDDNEGKQSIDLIDIAKALYVIALGPKALKPIMEVEHSIKRIQVLEKMAAQRPEFMKIYSDKLDEISKREAYFEEQALLYYEEYMNSVDIQNVAETIVTMLNDAFEPMEMMPDGKGEESTEKKS